jgi:short-subunit dehydrogenase
MERDAADLAIRHGVRAVVVRFDADAFDTHAGFFRDAAGRFPGGLDGVVLCYGYMADQKAAQRDFALALRTIHTNYASAVSLLEIAADYFERRGRGFICALSSVAGDRGRQSNYIYGSSKAALTAYLQGLRNRLTRAGVPVVTVKPGFVDTAMTWGLVKPGSPVVASPERVADDIVRAVRAGTAEVYTPWFWRGIMGVIKAIPEGVFRRMRI